MIEEMTNIFGIRAIIESIESGSTINKIYLQKGLRGNLFYELDKLIELLCETKRWKLAYWAHQKILLGNRNSSSTEIGQATAKAGAYSLSLFFFKKLDCLNNNGSSTFNYEVSKVLRREFWGGFEYFWY